jgi:hypothetical protein
VVPWFRLRGWCLPGLMEWHCPDNGRALNGSGVALCPGSSAHLVVDVSMLLSMLDRVGG